jgi:hypothetical protein
MENIMKKTVDEMISEINSISKQYFVLPMQDAKSDHWMKILSGEDDDESEFLEAFFASRQGFSQPKVFERIKAEVN